jgi:hypothetical protein
MNCFSLNPGEHERQEYQQRKCTQGPKHSEQAEPYRKFRKELGGW